MPDNTLSSQAAKRLRGGQLPHVPPASSPTSSRVSLTLEAPQGANPEAVFSDPRREHGWRVALSWDDSAKVWQATILLPQEPTVLTYYFVLRNGSTIRERHQVEGEIEMLFGVWEERDFQIAVYDPDNTPPAWIPGTIFYQIFPDRFAQGNPDNVRKGGESYGQEPLYLSWDDKPEHPPKSRDFFGGDLPGVLDKLDYLAELGVTCIYLTPIFASPSNHRYDASDYSVIDPRLGTEADLRELIAAASERGIRILLDGVFNHCSSDSIYFKGALTSRQSPYYRWFDFLRWPDRWVGWLGIRNKLAGWGIKTMPEFVECPEVEEFFLGQDGIARRWLSFGTAGWRTDVTPWMTDEFWRRFRKAVRGANPEAYLVAEDWENAPHRLVGDTFDATMNYHFGYSVMGFATGKLTPSELDDRLETRRRDTPPQSFHAQMNILGSHDTARILTRMEGNKARVKLAAALQLAYPGSPMIYYGDEAGVEGSYAEEGRAPYPWGKEDPQLLDFYRRAINARRDNAALGKGDVATVWIDDRGGYGILRTHGGERVVALFNNGDTPLEAEIALGDGFQDADLDDLLSTLDAAQIRGGTLNATVPALGAGWYRLP